MFFTAPTPTETARGLGTGLLREAMPLPGQMDLTSYDRLFPAQDGGCGPSTEGRSMAARTQRVILWVVLSIIVGVCLVIGAFWLYAVVTGGKYM